MQPLKVYLQKFRESEREKTMVAHYKDGLDGVLWLIGRHAEREREGHQEYKGLKKKHVSRAPLGFNCEC